MKHFSPCVSATNGTPFLKSAATFKSAGNCISDCTARLSWRVKGVRIEISACEMAPDKLVGFLFHLPAGDGVAMLARLHAARQDFLSQLRLPPACPWHKEKQWCKRSGSQWKFPAHSSVSNRSPPTLPVQWVATHPCPGAICAPRSTHGMGWNLARFCLLSDSLPLLWKADMLPVDTTELLTPGLKTGKMLLD